MSEIQQFDHFYNAGFGWVCIQCERDLTQSHPTDSGHSRMFLEGEAESRSPDLSSSALARWTDPSHKTLICPRCGVSELIDKH